MFQPVHLRSLLLSALLLAGGALYAQHYQGRDHTVFHPPARTTTKRSSPAGTTGASAAHPTESASHRRDATYNVPGNSHPAQPPQIPPRTH
jgi:hypothetical protein